MEKLKILVVDDESWMRKLVKYFMVRSNYDVIEAENGNRPWTSFSRPRE